MLADLKMRNTMPGHTAVSHDICPNAQSAGAQTAVAALSADGVAALRCLSDWREAACTLIVKETRGHVQKDRTNVDTFLNTIEISSSVQYKCLQKEECAYTFMKSKRHYSGENVKIIRHGKQSGGSSKVKLTVTIRPSNSSPRCNTPKIF